MSFFQEKKFNNVRPDGSATVSAALYHNVSISASATVKISTYIPVESSGSPVVVIAKNPTLTFTAYGAEVIETPFNN